MKQKFETKKFNSIDFCVSKNLCSAPKNLTKIVYVLATYVVRKKIVKGTEHRPNHGKSILCLLLLFSFKLYLAIDF